MTKRDTMPQRVIIVIPCYNEGDALKQSVQELIALNYEVVVVDDGSTCSAWEQLKELPVHFLRHCINLGQGAALQTGMDYARQLGADAVVHFDADGQHSPANIPALLAALDNCDIALGSRFLRQEDLSQVPFLKRQLLRCARLVNFVFTGLWLSDAHNGFRALGPKALACIDLTENRMAHATEILSQVKSHGLIWREVPTSIRYTSYSKQKGQRWYNSLNILIDLILNKIL